MKRALSRLFITCSCSGGRICLFCVQLALAAIVIVLGALIAWKPKKTIEIQIALYKSFNWKLEPISLEKEIRNTRIMGLAALIIGIFSLIYIILF